MLLNHRKKHPRIVYYITRWFDSLFPIWRMALLLLAKVVNLQHKKTKTDKTYGKI